jgi:phosphate transport system protein
MVTGLTVAEELAGIEEQLLALGSLVEGLLIDSARTLYGINLDALNRFSQERQQVHRQRLAIEIGCLGLIASRRSLDGNLRHLVATVEIAADLDRIADHAERVARANYASADQRLRKPLDSLHCLATQVQFLLDGALAAYSGRDLSAARTVTAEIHRVVRLYQQARQELLAVMRNKPRMANQAIFLSRSAGDLRRAAERVAGICEWVAFSVDGSLHAYEPRSVSGSTKQSERS